MLKQILSPKMSIVVYRERKNPQMFQVAPTLPFFFLVLMPAIALISLALLLAGARYFHSLRQDILSMVPEQVKILQEEKSELQENLTQLQKLTTTLQQKIATPTQGGDKVIFPLFKAPMAFKDQTQLNIMHVEEFKVATSSDSATLNFKIVNASNGGSKIRGRIFVLMQQKNKVMIHPPHSTDNSEHQIHFTSGESFAARRFRPVKIQMPLEQTPSALKFTVLVFSSTGDLIHKSQHPHQYNPYDSSR